MWRRHQYDPTSIKLPVFLALLASHASRTVANLPVPEMTDEPKPEGAIRKEHKCTPEHTEARKKRPSGKKPAGTMT